MRFISLLFAGSLVCSSAFAQVYKDPQKPVEERVSSLLAEMTLDEKLDYIGGVDAFYIRGIERLGLPKIKMSDGPVGVRTYGKAVAYPASILSAATWDTSLVRQLGSALGKDSKARGVHILLAPGVNIFRASMNGRNFEYLGEDPFLTSRMAVSYIDGVQSQDVVATVKHFAANNQEWNRHHVSSDMDERTLQEIYLPAFKAAVQEANVGAVMNSYNLVNGVHATQNAHLNLDILKNGWKFDGILMSDWESVYDGVAAAKNGLDIEMPSAKFMNKATLMPAINDSSLSVSLINDKVTRILRIIFRYGFYDKDQLDRSIPEDNPDNDKVALEAARNGMVLLKNDLNTLPFSSSKIKTLAVIGPNADVYVTGGGSSQTSPFHSVTVMQGLQKLVGDKVKLVCIPGFRNVENAAKVSAFFTTEAATEKGLKAEYFNGKELKGDVIATRTEEFADHNWKDMPDVNGLGADNFSIRWTGVVKPVATGNYRFTVKGDDGYRLWIDDKLVIDDWNDHAATINNADIKLQAGKTYRVKLEYFENGGDAIISLAWYPAGVDFSEAIAAAKKADAAIVCVGFNESTEHEGGDRPFNLPSLQDELINAVAKANKNTVVVLNAGGNVNMQPWLKNVKGLLHAWFPGQEGGTAIAEILFGKVNPSGKLPASFEKNWKDNPVFNSYYDDDKDLRVTYKEGLFVGYRYWDSSKVKPQFAFGYGLSYTNFTYSNLRISNSGGTGKTSEPMVTVSIDVKNTGNFDGADVVQVYVHQQKSPVIRPFKELKGFSKVFLKKGETKTVKIQLDAAAFSYYKGAAGFGYDPGVFEILVARAANDIRIKGTVEIL